MKNLLVVLLFVLALGLVAGAFAQDTCTQDNGASNAACGPGPQATPTPKPDCGGAIKVDCIGGEQEPPPPMQVPPAASASALAKTRCPIVPPDCTGDPQVDNGPNGCITLSQYSCNPQVGPTPNSMKAQLAKQPLSGQEFKVRQIYQQLPASAISNFHLGKVEELSSVTWKEFGIALDGSPAATLWAMPDAASYTTYSLYTVTPLLTKEPARQALMFFGKHLISGASLIYAVDPGHLPQAEIPLPTMSDTITAMTAKSKGCNVVPADCTGDPATDNGPNGCNNLNQNSCGGATGGSRPPVINIVADNPTLWLFPPDPTGAVDTWIDPVLFDLDRDKINPGLGSGNSACNKCWLGRESICEQNYNDKNRNIAMGGEVSVITCTIVGLIPGAQLGALSCLLATPTAVGVALGNNQSDLQSCISKVQYDCYSLCPGSL